MNDSDPKIADKRSAIQKQMPLKIGVMGGASREVSSQIMEKAYRLGEAIARSGCITITGACPGLPQEAALGASSEGGVVIGVSPALSLDEHAYRYQSPTLGHDVLIFTGSGLMGREVVNIRTSDIVTIVGGSSGTLGELSIAYDEGKLIGVLTNTGGISDMVEDILSACNKETGARVVYDANPVQLIKSLISVYREEHFRHPSVFCGREYTSKKIDTKTAGVDPVCGMLIKPGSAAARRTIGSRKIVFCSLDCASQFDLNFSKYTNDQALEQD